MTNSKYKIYFCAGQNQSVYVVESTQHVVVMPQTILPRRNRRGALSATGTRKSEEEKDARGVTCFMEKNEILFTQPLHSGRI